MKHTKLLLTSIAVLSISGAAFAQASLNVPLPNGAAPMPYAAASAPVQAAAPAPMNTVVKGPAGNVDKVLEKISHNMLPMPDVIDSQAEANINRDVNLSRSTGQMLRPVGYMQIGDERAIFASEDGVRVLKLKEQSRFGVMKIARISEDGVEYKVSGKDMYAPLAYMATEAPKGPQNNGAQSLPGGMSAQVPGISPNNSQPILR